MATRVSVRPPLLMVKDRGRSNCVSRHRREDSGATAVEYGLLVALIAGVIIAAVMVLGISTRGAFQAPCDQLAAAGHPC